MALISQWGMTLLVVQFFPVPDVVDVPIPFLVLITTFWFADGFQNQVVLVRTGTLCYKLLSPLIADSTIRASTWTHVLVLLVLMRCIIVSLNISFVQVWSQCSMYFCKACSTYQILGKLNQVVPPACLNPIPVFEDLIVGVWVCALDWWHQTLKSRVIKLIRPGMRGFLSYCLRWEVLKRSHLGWVGVGVRLSC